MNSQTKKENLLESDSENPEKQPSASMVDEKRRAKEGKTFQGSGKQVTK